MSDMSEATARFRDALLDSEAALRGDDDKDWRAHLEEIVTAAREVVKLNGV
jgi:hypothetical protein